MSYRNNFAPFHKVDMSKHSSDRHIDDFLQMVVNYSSAKLEVVAQEELYCALGRNITPIIDTIDELVNLIETCKLSIETPFCTGFIPAWVLVDMLRFECLQPQKNTAVMRYIISLIKECE